MSEMNMNQPKGIVMHFDKYHAALDSVVECVKEDQPKLERLTCFKDKPTIYREHRTIHFGGARQTGKTYWGLKNSNPETLYLVMVPQLIESHKWTLKDAFQRDPETFPLIMGRMEFWSTLKRPLDHPKRMALIDENKGKFKQVIVDDASFFFDNHSRKTFYEAVESICHEDVIFIFLG